jgi:penicillin-insensitive murein endopeptidase
VRGPGFERYRPQGEHYYGVPRLVRALERVAQAVAEERPGGAPLLIGDLSARRGGRIPGHRSHRTGRDVDLLFYVTTPSGTPVRSPGFIPFGPDGLARVGETTEYVRFDVERNWLLVRELVTSDLGIQLLLVSGELEALLVDYAVARGEPPEVIWRAVATLIEPTDSTKHDDHFHVRIGCSREEALHGCEANAPFWEWLEPGLPVPQEFNAVELQRIAEADPFALVQPGDDA